MRWWWSGGIVMMACALLAPPARAQDCNANGVPDAADVFPAAFASSSVATVQPAPGRLAVADLDDDGLPDIALVHPFTDAVTTLKNAGGAAFVAGTTISTADRPEDVLPVPTGLELLCVTPPCSTTALVVSNAGATSVSRWQNQGDGTFTEASGSPDAIPIVGALPSRLVGADLSTPPDGFIDLVALDRGTSQISVFGNDMMDDFFLQGSAPTVGEPVDAVLADVNLDGNLDLLVAGRTGNAIRLHLGGSMPTPPTDVVNNPQPVALVAADLSGDGIVDLAFVSAADEAVHIVTGVGDGGFTTAQTISIGGAPTAIVQVDLDGDGRRDLAVARGGGNSVALLRNVGGGSFGGPIDVAVGMMPVAIAAADLDLDGRPDLVTSNAVSGTVTILRQLATPHSLDCNATGVPDECELGPGDCNANAVPDSCELTRTLRFAPPVSSVLTTSRNSVLAAADLTGDGHAEVVVADTTDDKIYVLPVLDTGVATSGTSVDAPNNPRRMLVADLEPDGDRDVVLVNASGSAVGIFRNGGDGTLAPQTLAAVGHTTLSVAAADLDGDGAPELLAGTDQPGVTLLHNAGSSFGLPVDVALTAIPFGLATGDLDGDGDRDVVAVTIMMPAGTTQMQVLRNAGGVLTAEPPLPGPPSGWFWAALAGGDVDADGDLDLTLFEISVPLGDGRLVVMRNTGGVLARDQVLPIHADVPPAAGTIGPPGAASYGIAILGGPGLVVGDLDGDGAPDLAAALGGRVVDFHNDGHGAFAPGARAPVGGLVRQLAAADVDGDGSADLVAGDAVHRLTLLRSASAPTATACAVAGQPDECASDYSDCNANDVADACELASVDDDADGVADCLELGSSCSNCRDDDGDGSLDLADASCPSTALTLRRVRATAKRGGRIKLSAELPTALDDPAPLVTVGSDASALYCGGVNLRKRGPAWRMRGHTGALRALVFTVRKRTGTTRVKGVVDGTLPAGAALRLSVLAKGVAYSGTGVPAKP